MFLYFFLQEIIKICLDIPDQVSLQEESYFQLENHKNLVDQCVQGEGIVQINIQVQTHLKRINIIDVLKAAEDYDFGKQEQIISNETVEILNISF